MKVYQVWLDGQPGPTYETVDEAMRESSYDVTEALACETGTARLTLREIEMTREEFDNLPEFRGW